MGGGRERDQLARLQFLNNTPYSVLLSIMSSLIAGSLTELALSISLSRPMMNAFFLFQQDGGGLIFNARSLDVYTGAQIVYSNLYGAKTKCKYRFYFPAFKFTSFHE